MPRKQFKTSTMIYSVDLLKTKADCDAAMVMSVTIRKLVNHGKEGVSWNAEADAAAVVELNKKIAKENVQLIADQGAYDSVDAADVTTKKDAENDVKSTEVRVYNLQKLKASHGAVAFLKSQIATARFDNDLVELAAFDVLVLAKKDTLAA